MRTADRKLVYSAVVILVVVGVELAWLLFVGPTEGSPACGTNSTPQCDLPWWDSASFWTAAFTFFLTVSTALLWWQTRRLAIGADDQAEKMRISIREQRRTAFANLVAARAARQASAAAITQANVAIGVELPILRVTRAFTSLDSAYTPENWIREFHGKIEVKNFGRTTAFVNECIINAKFGGWTSDPSYQPQYTRLDKYPPMVPITAGDTQTFRSYYLRQSFTQDDIDYFVKEESLLLYGIIHFNDFMGKPHTQEWGFLWIPENRAFASLAHAPGYNRQT